MEKRRKVAGAPIAMRKRGLQTDELTLGFVRRNPGLTVRQIALQLGWSIGRADGSINRLIKAGKVKAEHALQRGILTKRVSEITYSPRPKDLVEIPKDMIDEKLWNKTVKVYALSRSTIGISPLERDEWKEKALTKEQIKIREDNMKLKFKLSEKLSDFYELENSETSLSAVNDLALLTVESTILPVSLPQTHPALVPFVLEREIRITERFVGMIAQNPTASAVKSHSTQISVPSDSLVSPEKLRAHISPEIISDSSETKELVLHVEAQK